MTLVAGFTPGDSKHSNVIDTRDVMKRIALFLDGTWNTVENNTNVWRAKSLCPQTEDQIAYYSKGVGTTRGEQFTGGVFGWGLDKEVTDAYQWLIEHYEPTDQIYIFGFSRGAYTARSLSGLISKLGLLQAGSPLSIDQLYARYRKSNTRSLRELKSAVAQPGATLANEEKWLLTYSQAIAIWFIGVWDTVGALGLPFGNLPVVSRKQYQFLQTDLWVTNDTAYHAMAVDEHRKAFLPTLWTWPYLKGDPKATGVYTFPTLSNVEQRWFVGAHANVGGGYNDDLLAQRPLKWLIEKAMGRGLRFKADVTIDDGEFQAPVNDSFKEMLSGVYRLCHACIPYYRKLGTIPAGATDVANNVVNETIDASVFERWRANANYRPKNLIEWAARNDTAVEAITTSVQARDAKIPIS